MIKESRVKIELEQLPSPFYRVGVKALVLDDQQRLLLVFNENGNPELPGGGWEHNESMEAGLQRELQEEIGVQAQRLSPVQFVFRGVSVHGWHVLRVVVRVELKSYDFILGDGMTDTRWVTKSELLKLEFNDPADAAIKDCVDQIWAPR